MNVRAKFRVTEVKKSLYVSSTEKPAEVVVLSAAMGDENKQWAKYTPSGQISMQIDNPAALEQFEIGKFFYVDFTDAPEKD